MEMSIDDLIASLPELGITQKVETRTTHFKDGPEHGPEGHVEPIVVYRTNTGASIDEADMHLAFEMKNLKELEMA